jgi:hypothetical protein
VEVNGGRGRTSSNKVGVEAGDDGGSCRVRYFVRVASSKSPMNALEGAAGAIPHGTSVCLGIKLILPLEVSQFEDGFEQHDDVVYGHGGALVECGVVLEAAADGGDGWGAWNAGEHIGDVKRD